MLLNIKNLSFAYKEKSILEDVNFSINNASMVCLLGANGIGKSTLFKCILRLEKFNKGIIEVMDKDIRKYSNKVLAQKIAYVPQKEKTVFGYSVFDSVLMGTTPSLKLFQQPSNKEYEIVDKCLENVGITHLKNKQFNSLSGGEQQLALLARALAQNSKILVLDEPCSNLDYGNQIKIMTKLHELAKKGHLVLLSIHSPELVFLFSDRVLILDDKKIIADGNAAEVMTKNNLEKIYNIELDIKVIQAKHKQYTILLPEF